MLYALVRVLYCGMLVYHTWKVVVHRCLSAEGSGVTVAMNVWEDMHVSEGRHSLFSYCDMTS
jgi:hypothetical protein